MGNRIKHFKVITKHRWEVFKECCHCGIPWRGFTHDLSKYSHIEFSASAKHFQGGKKSPISAEKKETGYSMAWQHHQNHNPHHWEYWIDFDRNGNPRACKMPYKYVVEMVCDWIGAGKVYGGGKWTQKEPLTHYKNHRKGRHFHPETEALCKFFLTTIAYMGLERFYKYAKNKEVKKLYEDGGFVLDYLDVRRGDSE